MFRESVARPPRVPAALLLASSVLAPIAGVTVAAGCGGAEQTAYVEPTQEELDAIEAEEMAHEEAVGDPTDD